jgi:PAS domain S-box-containing protein
MVDDKGGRPVGAEHRSDRGTAFNSLSRNAPDALGAIVESSDDAIYSKDRNTVITSWNASAERLYGYTAEEAIGRPVEILVPATKRGEELDILNKILRGEKVHHYRTQRVRKDGVEIEVSIAVSPVHDAAGEIVQAAVVARDVTEQVKLDEALELGKKTQGTLDRKRALELNDEVVQGLAVAKLALETDDHERGLRAVTAALERAKAAVAGLLEDGTETPVKPGDLVRERRIEEPE